MDDFERHLETQKCGPKPEVQQCQIYNARMVAREIQNTQGGNVVSNAQDLAVDLVKEMAIQSGRQEWFEDPWGLSEEIQTRRLRHGAA